MTRIPTVGIGKLFEGVSPSLMARVVGSDAVALTQSDIASIAYSIWDLSATGTVVNSGSLTVANVIFDALQTDARWTADSTGYNFRWQPAGSLFPAFDPAAGAVDDSKTFRLEIVLTDTAAAEIALLFELTLSNLYGRAGA